MSVLKPIRAATVLAQHLVGKEAGRMRRDTMRDATVPCRHGREAEGYMFASVIFLTDLKNLHQQGHLDRLRHGQKETLAISDDRLPSLAAVAKRDRVEPS